MSARRPAPAGERHSTILDLARASFPRLDAHWPRYARFTSTVTLPPRTVILKQGEIPRKIFFVEKGCLRASMAAHGKDVTFQFFFEGDAVASIDGFRTSQPSPISITTVERCELIAMKKEGFDAILRDHPEMKDLLLELAFRRFSDYSRLFLSYLRDSPRQRYMALMRDDPRIIARVPQRYVASYLGITPVSLSRIRHRL